MGGKEGGFGGGGHFGLGAQKLHVGVRKSSFCTLLAFFMLKFSYICLYANDLPPFIYVRICVMCDSAIKSLGVCVYIVMFILWVLCVTVL